MLRRAEQCLTPEFTGPLQRLRWNEKLERTDNITDEELEEIYNDAISEGGTVFDGLRAVVMAEREACAKEAEAAAELKSGNDMRRKVCNQVAGFIRGRSNVGGEPTDACGRSARP